jgi:hypothetical protein
MRPCDCLFASPSIRQAPDLFLIGLFAEHRLHRGGDRLVNSALWRIDAPEPPKPGLPLIRLDVTTSVGTVHLRHPGTPARTRPRPYLKRR